MSYFLFEIRNEVCMIDSYVWENLPLILFVDSFEDLPFGFSFIIIMRNSLLCLFMSSSYSSSNSEVFSAVNFLLFADGVENKKFWIHSYARWKLKAGINSLIPSWRWCKTLVCEFNTWRLVKKDDLFHSYIIILSISFILLFSYYFGFFCYHWEELMSND